LAGALNIVPRERGKSWQWAVGSWQLAVGRFRSYEYSGLRAVIGDNRSSEI